MRAHGQRADGRDLSGVAPVVAAALPEVHRRRIRLVLAARTDARDLSLEQFVIWVIGGYLGLTFGFTCFLVVRGYVKTEMPTPMRERCSTCNVPLMWDCEGENICTHCGVSRA